MKPDQDPRKIPTRLPGFNFIKNGTSPHVFFLRDFVYCLGERISRNVFYWLLPWFTSTNYIVFGFSLFYNRSATRATQVLHEWDTSDAILTQVRHEWDTSDAKSTIMRHECNTSNKRATQVQGDWDKSDASMTQVRHKKKVWFCEWINDIDYGSTSL